MRDDDRPDPNMDAVLEPDRNARLAQELAEERARGPDLRDRKISKHFRVRIRYSEALRDRAFLETVRQGTRVSEADLVDEIIGEGLAKRGWL